jgi:hypothetical protein
MVIVEVAVDQTRSNKQSVRLDDFRPRSDGGSRELTHGGDAAVADRNVGKPNFTRIDIDDATAPDDNIGEIPP